MIIYFADNHNTFFHLLDNPDDCVGWSPVVLGNVLLIWGTVIASEPWPLVDDADFLLSDRCTLGRL